MPVINRVEHVIHRDLTVKYSEKLVISMKTVAEQNTQIIDFTGDPRWELVQRIIESPHLAASARLRDFLLHVTACAIRETPEDATEQQIGIRVFQKSPGFNSSEDSVVRSQARLLRLKLSVYFNAEGAAEPLMMEIPKGHYLPVFLPAGEGTHGSSFRTRLNRRGLDNRHWRIAAAIFLIMLGLSTVGVRLWQRHQTSSKPLNRLWAPFLTGDPPLVIYSSAVFIGDSKRGIRYAASDGSDNTATDQVYNYTGIGELVSVHEVTQLFDRHHAEFQLKRSLLVTWDEARERNLIFIGSVAENSSLKAIPSTQDFTFMATPDAAGIINHHPRNGEPASYIRPERPLTKDYAIIALLPGIQPDLHMLVFSGLTTLGTEAAVEYAATPETAAELMKQIARDGKVHNFEALLEVDISGGVPLQPKLVTLRVH
jgi:hypothetical protein